MPEKYWPRLKASADKLVRVNPRQPKDAVHLDSDIANLVEHYAQNRLGSALVFFGNGRMGGFRREIKEAKKEFTELLRQGKVPEESRAQFEQIVATLKSTMSDRDVESTIEQLEDLFNIIK